MNECYLRRNNLIIECSTHAIAMLHNMQKRNLKFKIAACKTFNSVQENFCNFLKKVSRYCESIPKGMLVRLTITFTWFIISWKNVEVAEFLYYL